MLGKIKIGILALIVISLTGCGTTYILGRPFNTENVVKITIGKTTQNDILNMFGEPLRKGISNGNDVFTYTYEEITFDLDDTVIRDGDTLYIEFDENNVVKKYYLNVPGRETELLGYLMHKRNKEKEEEQASHQPYYVNGQYY
ncbi:hypothetical protein ACFL2X_06365 [Candidatus Latescibacterota bacterium]